jgi:isochorismate synthase
MSSCIGFAAYRLPGTEAPQLMIQEHGNVMMPNDGLSIQSDGFTMIPFCEDHDKPSIFIKEDKHIHGMNEICLYLNSIDFDIQTITYSGRNNYHDAFNKFINVLDKNEYKKLVLSCSKIFLTSYTPAELFKTACTKYPHLMVYLCYTQESGLWLGCTPEIILDGCGNLFHTIALAGTQTLLEGDMIRKWDDKNILEQKLVTDYIRDIITEYSNTLNISSPYTHRAGQLAHLRTDFFFDLKDSVNIMAVLQALHPTPAVCGLPKKQAYQFINENEGYDRRYYAGVVGPIKNKEIHLYVNLRCAEIFKNATRLYVGSGLLPESYEISEYEEVKEKMKTIKSIL